MGFLGIDRGIREHWIYQDAEYLKVWLEMMLLARYSEEPHTELIDGELVKVDYGQFIFGRVSWSKRLRISEQRLRTLVEKLKREEMLTQISAHRKCSVYALNNYAKFNHQSNHQRILQPQGISDFVNHQDNHPVTISQPSANHQPTTKEQSNKVTKKQIKKENKDIGVFDSYTSNAELIETLEAFVEFRKKAKSPLTDHGIKLLLKNLDKLSEVDSEKIEILNRSIVNSWKGVFALKNKNNVVSIHTQEPSKKYIFRDVE